nr:hypothetical protein [Endomicrobiaceae bacterium]
ISNATTKEQVLTIVGSLISNQNLDGVNINILVQQLNQIFSQDINVSLIDEGKQLEFTFKDGSKQMLDVDKDIANIVEDQKKTSLDSKEQLVQLTGDDLKSIVSLVSKTTFNQGTGVFVPQMYQISKDVCLFMVENKWFLGDGAVWEIASSEYDGKSLDGVEPVIYEYMPDFMQKALESRQMDKDLLEKKKKSKRILGKMAAFFLSVLIMFNLSGCSNRRRGTFIYEPYQIQEISVTEEQQEFNDTVSEVLSNHYVGNGAYKSFLYNDTIGAFGDDRYALINLENLYDQSLAALSYMQIGDVEKASEILHAINATPFLSISNLEGSVQKTGEVVWVGIAAVQYRLLTGDSSIDSLIGKVDSYLEKNRARDGDEYFYWGGNVGHFVSTEHYFDILSYFNLKSLLYSDKESEEAVYNEELLKEAAEYIYNNLYDEQTQTFGRGLDDDFQVLDVYSWGIQTILSLKAVNPEIYNNSSLSKIDIENLLDYADNTFRKEVEYNGVTYQNLYKWSDESASPVSFEWTLELAIAYKMAGNNEKAEAINKDVIAYSKALGFDSYIPYSDVNGEYNYYYYGDGWKVWQIPALCTEAQEVQYQYNSFFMPLSRLDKQQNYFIGQGDSEYLYFKVYQDSNWKTYASSNLVDILHAQTIEMDLELLNDVPDACVQIQLLTVDPAKQNLEGTAFGLYDKKYYFDSDGKLKLVLDMGDFLHIENYDANNPPSFYTTNLELIRVIVIAGKTSFFDNNLNSENLVVNIKNITITYADDSKQEYSPTGESLFSDEEPVSDIPSSILPSTLQKINRLIAKGTVSMKAILMEILNSETTESLISPLNFIRGHSNNIGAKILITVTVITFLLSFGFLLSNMIPILVAALSSLSTALFANAGTHAIMDYRYLKSIGLPEAISLYGKDNVRMNENGLEINNEDKVIPVYVINDTPKNVKDFNMKPVSIKIKTAKGEYAKCWIGDYNGAIVLFSKGVEYEDIVNEFSKTRKFESICKNNTVLKANVDVIEIDMVDSDSGLRYSKNGNLIIGANILKSADRIDLQKEISLLKIKKVEAVTINQNIAIYIDDAVDTISASQDFINVIDSYFKSENLGVDAKILFSNEYIDRVLELLEQELGSKESAQQRFMEIIKELKDKNKDIIVIFDEYVADTNFNKYQDYGIFSYIAGNEYVDGITSTKTQAKFVTNLNQIACFDGSLSIVKMSVFKKEIEQSSGIFTFLTSSLNLKDYMKKRSINFIKQVAGNFDYNQLPNIDIETVAKILKSENKFENLKKYLQENDSITMYYLGLSGEEEKAVFMNAILERILVANYLRFFDTEEFCFGLKDKKMETILAAALIAKYNKDGNFNVSSQAVMNENLTAAQFELEFEKMILDKVSTGFKNELSEINDPQSIDDIIKLIPLYAERNVELRTANVKVMEIQDIKGILSAA